ncbi:3-beta hydroxysteroid dehydrogenase [Lactobacillus delbrueckii subsp. bulgaricus]|nr:3-beta hydroxysteroid dehydrogenase [Lactobacillus delbrueckii subsp. bulgaricus]
MVPYLPELVARGNVIYPVGDQAMSFISRKDSAEAIANVAVRPYLRDKGQIYLGYQPVSLEEFANIYRAEGDGDELASMYKAPAMGLMDGVTDDFTRITGHTPQNMKDFLAENYKK